MPPFRAKVYKENTVEQFIVIMAKIKPDLCIVVKNIVYKSQNIWSWETEAKSMKTTKLSFSFQRHNCVISLIIKLQQKVISLRPLWINGDYYIPLID